MENLTDDFFSTVKEELKPKLKKNKTKVFIIFLILLVLSFFLAQGFSIYNLLNPTPPSSLSKEDLEELNMSLDKRFPERKQILSALPFQNVPLDLFINAESAIIIDALTGNILFEKNANIEIPPASMTKLVEMFVVFEAVEKGEISLDDIVPLPPESWARNLPSDASIMFLNEGQIVTLRELLLGLSIASGNDASIAIAHYVCRNMDNFVQRMNNVVKSLGLQKTHFVESSGYSEKNITTAREFAAFCKVYVERFPFAIKEFHSQRVLKYPLKKNLPKGIAEKVGDSQAVIQYNTNKLLGNLEGCDGLKTGFINESGYNIALTAERHGSRYISVTMRGPGNNSAQGNVYRTKDGTNLMEFAFTKFAPYVPKESHSFTVGVTGSKLKSINLIPAKKEAFSVPFIFGKTPNEAAENIHVTANIPQSIFGSFAEGQEFGILTYSLNGKVLNTVPLVSDRPSAKTNLFSFAWGKITYAMASLFAN